MKIIISETPAKLGLRNDKDASFENTSLFEQGLIPHRAERRLSPLSLIKVTRLTFFSFFEILILCRNVRSAPRVSHFK